METYVKFVLVYRSSKVFIERNIVLGFIASFLFITSFLFSSLVLMMSVHGECYDFDHAPYGEWDPCGNDEGYEIDQGFLILSPTQCLGVSSICKEVVGPIDINFWWKHVGGELTFWVGEKKYECRNSSGESRTIPIVGDGAKTIKWKFTKGGLGQSASIDYICIGDNHKEAGTLDKKTDTHESVIAGDNLTSSAASLVNVTDTEPDSNLSNIHAEEEPLVHLDNPGQKIYENLTTYVDKNRDPDPDAYIYNSINEAIEHVKINGTVNVASGNYFENVKIDKPLRLVGDHIAATVIQGTDINSDVVNIAVSDVTIKGFTIKNGDCGIHVYNGSNCSLIDNSIYNCSFGIIIDNSDFPQIINNNIYNTTANPGIDLLNSSNCMLFDNRVYNSHIASIYFEAGSNDSVLNGNLLSRQTGSGIILVESNGNNLEHNNTFIDARGCDVYEYGTCIGNKFPKNCIELLDFPGCWSCKENQ